MKKFTKEDLVSFGNYLLSEERRKLYESHPLNHQLPPIEDRLGCVNHSDLENWKARENK